ncbi:MAG TPA: hypothetical protein O0X66_00740 [Methanocorpusculum sp.]|nr:hypothetical protein [Methanocorpusculum sp.]HJJ53019.1 hypothetical protein [Methanocorpusculum sp.]
MKLTPKDALVRYHLAERLKLDIMMIAHQFVTINSLKKEEKAGGKAILITLTDILASDCRAASKQTGAKEFDLAAAVLLEVIGLAESNQFGLASDKAGEAMTPITTVAAGAYTVLNEHGLI